MNFDLIEQAFTRHLSSFLQTLESHQQRIKTLQIQPLVQTAPLPDLLTITRLLTSTQKLEQPVKEPLPVKQVGPEKTNEKDVEKSQQKRIKQKEQRMERDQFVRRQIAEQKQVLLTLANLVNQNKEGLDLVHDELSKVAVKQELQTLKTSLKKHNSQLAKLQGKQQAHSKGLLQLHAHFTISTHQSMNNLQALVQQKLMWQENLIKETTSRQQQELWILFQKSQSTLAAKLNQLQISIKASLHSNVESAKAEISKMSQTVEFEAGSRSRLQDLLYRELRRLQAAHSARHQALKDQYAEFQKKLAAKVRKMIRDMQSRQEQNIKAVVTQKLDSALAYTLAKQERERKLCNDKIQQLQTQFAAEKDTQTALAEHAAQMSSRLDSLAESKANKNVKEGKDVKVAIQALQQKIKKIQARTGRVEGNIAATKERWQIIERQNQHMRKVLTSLASQTAILKQAFQASPVAPQQQKQRTQQLKEQESAAQLSLRLASTKASLDSQINLLKQDLFNIASRCMESLSNFGKNHSSEFARLSTMIFESNKATEQFKSVINQQLSCMASCNSVEQLKSGLLDAITRLSLQNSDRYANRNETREAIKDLQRKLTTVISTRRSEKKLPSLVNRLKLFRSQTINQLT